MSHTANQLAYEGTVRMRVVDHGHTLYSTTLKNKGTKKLFEFLSLCLVGTYTPSLVPKRLRLLYTAPGTRQACSSFVSFSKAPTTETRGDSAIAVLSFVVPRSYIYSAVDGNGEEHAFNQIGLYTETEYNLEEMYAYYDISEAEAQKMNPASWSQTSLLIIDWELQLSNKQDIRTV